MALLTDENFAEFKKALGDFKGGIKKWTEVTNAVEDKLNEDVAKALKIQYKTGKGAKYMQNIQNLVDQLQHTKKILQSLSKDAESYYYKAYTAHHGG